MSEIVKTNNTYKIDLEGSADDLVGFVKKNV